MKYLCEYLKRLNHANQAFLLAAIMLSITVCAAVSTASASGSAVPVFDSA